MQKILNSIRLALLGYEPVALRAAISAVFAALALGGIGTGELPGWAETVLALLTIGVPFVLSMFARAKVVPEAKLPESTKGEHDSDLHPEDEDAADDPDDDFADEPGDHRLGKPIEPIEATED